MGARAYNFGPALLTLRELPDALTGTDTKPKLAIAIVRLVGALATPRQI